MTDTKTTDTTIIKLNVLPQLTIPSEDSAAEVSQFTEDAKTIIRTVKNFDIRSVNDLLSLVIPLMKEAVRFKNVSGETKKNIVIAALKLLVSQANISESLKTDINNGIDLMIPGMIDAVYSFSIDEFKADIKKCFTCCC